MIAYQVRYLGSGGQQLSPRYPSGELALEFAVGLLDQPAEMRDICVIVTRPRAKPAVVMSDEEIRLWYGQLHTRHAIDNPREGA